MHTKFLLVLLRTPQQIVCFCTIIPIIFNVFSKFVNCIFRESLTDTKSNKYKCTFICFQVIPRLNTLRISLQLILKFFERIFDSFNNNSLHCVKDPQGDPEGKGREGKGGEGKGFHFRQMRIRNSFQ